MAKEEKKKGRCNSSVPFFSDVIWCEIAAPQYADAIIFRICAA